MSSLLAARQLSPLQEQFFIVLSNSCCAVEHLLRNELVHERILAGTESTGKCLLGLFVLLYLETGPDPRLDCEPRGYISIRKSLTPFTVKATILESLTLIDETGFDEAVSSLCEEKKLLFVERLEERKYADRVSGFSYLTSLFSGPTIEKVMKL